MDKPKVTDMDRTDKTTGLPMDELFCPERPKVVSPPANRAVRRFMNWAQANSLFILAYGTGCGAIELRPLFTARYDISRYGIMPRPTPRQSGLFIIGGYMSVKTLKRAIRSYEQIQNPKFVMGLGSCTVNGGMYWDSYNTINRLDYYMPVDVYVTGCMPRPESIIAGFDELKKMIMDGEAEGANRYAENFDWYKENQKKIITDWDMPEYNW